MKKIQFNFMENIDYKIFTADKPGRMNTNLTLHHGLFVKSSTQNVQHTGVTVYCRTVWGGLTNEKEIIMIMKIILEQLRRISTG